MSLTILTTEDERLSGDAVTGLVRTWTMHGSALVLVPTFAEVLQTQKAFAAMGLSLGIEVTTPNVWVRDAWDLWGDGRRVIDGPARALLMSELLQGEQQGSKRIEQTPGTIRLLCALAQRGLPWIAEALIKKGSLLTPAELRAARLLEPYQALLQERGLVEGATCACILPEKLAAAGAALPPCVMAGFDDLNHADRALVLGMARTTDIVLVVRTAQTMSTDQAWRMVAQLELDAREQGMEVIRREESAKGHRTREEAIAGYMAPRASELEALQRSLFKQTAGSLEPTGAVRLLLPSGPLAEAELVAREVTALAHRGMQKVVVVVPDAQRAWRELAPKLIARGVSVRAHLSLPTLQTEAGRAFMGYARSVAQLVELNKSWPAPREGEHGIYVQTGDMSWWPPQELVDFLLNDIAHVEPVKARSLDIAWRSDRLLSPADVLEQLQSAKLTSSAVERATRELLRGRLGSAASKLLARYVDEGAGGPLQGATDSTSLAKAEATAVLAEFLGVASTLKELGVTADPAVASSVSLLELVARVELALGSTRVSLRPEVRAKEGRGHVLLVGRREAAALPTASFDAAVLCGLTSTEYAVPTGEGELDGMLCDLGIEPEPDPIVAQRSLFLKLCALPAKELLLERMLFSADAHQTYEAVMLTELLSCYARTLPSSSLPEDHARANLAQRGVAPLQSEQEEIAPAGRIDDALRRLVTVPQEGRAELPGGLPVLSASQLESYLECPLKWFSLRRLRLGDNDAGFGPLEMGTFAHRVLELTYTQLFEEGKANLDVRDEASMAYAQAVLDEHFRTHSEHQHMREGSHAAYQALIPHSSQEEHAMERLRRDLLSTLEYAATRLVGYEPRAFEWEFGRGHKSEAAEQGAPGGLPPLQRATYAGVRVTGTVDRIDINREGQAVIIDYKHKGPTGFFGEYAALSRGGEEGTFALPRRIQALLYAQVVRRAFPDVRIVGALYLGTRGTHELSGAVDEAQTDAIFAGTLGSRRAKQVVIDRSMTFGQADEHGMNAFLDATEQAIAQKVERLREGHIEAEPIDAAACSFCPVANCERRLK